MTPEVWALADELAASVTNSGQSTVRDRLFISEFPSCEALSVCEKAYRAFSFVKLKKCPQPSQIKPARRSGTFERPRNTRLHPARQAFSRTLTMGRWSDQPVWMLMVGQWAKVEGMAGQAGGAQDHLVEPQDYVIRLAESAEFITTAARGQSGR